MLSGLMPSLVTSAAKEPLVAIVLGVGVAEAVARDDADAVDLVVGDVVAADVAGDAASGAPLAQPANPNAAMNMTTRAAFFMNPPNFIWPFSFGDGPVVTAYRRARAGPR